jgi:hypothetical protein
MDKFERINRRKEKIGDRHIRKLKKYSDGFNRMFLFFFLINRRDLITFCGSNIEIKFDLNSPDAKEAFRLWEDGKWKGSIITTRHPNILKSLIIGKKGWGLWRNQWTDGISEGLFTYSDIMDEFTKRGIEIPEPLILEFNKELYNKKINFLSKYV